MVTRGIYRAAAIARHRQEAAAWPVADCRLPRAVGWPHAAYQPRRLVLRPYRHMKLGRVHGPQEVYTSRGRDFRPVAAITPSAWAEGVVSVPAGGPPQRRPRTVRSRSRSPLAACRAPDRRGSRRALRYNDA